MPKKEDSVKKRAVNAFVSRAGVYNTYESKPRTYGSDELLYPREVHAISAIGRNKSIDMGSLAKELGVTNGAATRTVEKLVAKGFVAKRKSPRDNRKYICRLTDKAKEIFAYHEALDNETYAELEMKLSVFSDEDIEKAIRLISLLGDTIKEWE